MPCSGGSLENHHAVRAQGLRLAALKLIVSTELAERLRAAQGQGLQVAIQFLTSEPVVAMVLEGHKAVDVCRKLMGKTFGYDAEPGTIRGDFGISNQFNLVHGSDSADTARREVELFSLQRRFTATSSPTTFGTRLSDAAPS